MLRVTRPGAGPETRVTSPKGPKTNLFECFFKVLRVRDQSQSLLQALKLNFPSKMCDLDAYLSSYVTFRRFCRVYCPGTAKRRIKEAVIKSAASAVSQGFAGERQDDGPACGRRGTGRSPANPREAALAADLITASLIRLLVVPGQ